MENRVAVITGSTKGIGRGIAEEFIKEGISVVITSRSPEAANEAAKILKEKGGNAFGLKFNLDDKEDIQPLIERTVNEYGRLDILVNNAFSPSGLFPLEHASQQQIEFALTANISNTLYLTKLAHPYLKANQGNIINISSVIVKRYLQGLTLYAISKAAMVQMTKSLAADWAGDGIRVNAINPGFVRTSAYEEMGMTSESIDNSYEFYKQYLALKKIGKPADVGKLALYLASDDAELITGITLDIDSGYSVNGFPLYQEG